MTSSAFVKSLDSTPQLPMPPVVKLNASNSTSSGGDGGNASVVLDPPSYDRLAENGSSSTMSEALWVLAGLVGLVALAVLLSPRVRAWLQHRRQFAYRIIDNAAGNRRARTSSVSSQFSDGEIDGLMNSDLERSPSFVQRSPTRSSKSTPEQFELEMGVLNIDASADTALGGVASRVGSGALEPLRRSSSRGALRKPRPTHLALGNQQRRPHTMGRRSFSQSPLKERRPRTLPRRPPQQLRASTSPDSAERRPRTSPDSAKGRLSFTLAGEGKKRNSNLGSVNTSKRITSDEAPFENGVVTSKSEFEISESEEEDDACEEDVYEFQPSLSGLDSGTSVLTSRALQQVYQSLPRRLHYQNWALLYSTAQHGRSLATFYRRVVNGGPIALVVQDTHKQVFGAFIPSDVRLGGRLVFGTGETFVFRIRSDKSQAVAKYGWTQRNDLFCHAEETFFAVGGGDHFALYFGSGMLEGSSNACETFASPQLSHRADFEIRMLEAWAFE